MKADCLHQARIIKGLVMPVNSDKPSIMALDSSYIYTDHMRLFSQLVPSFDNG